jgi:serine/threonine protein kinase
MMNCFFVKTKLSSHKAEFQALKRFRHPNIITLYGYAFNSNHSQQYLVYEYAAHGSLDGFFRDDAHRAQLTADIRLSIMFELTRAVHFLHSGGCNGYRLFHRDIKSANICLAEDYTVRLIDCGLSELVPINSSAPTTSTVMNCFSTNAALFGTPGYICPEFALNVSGGRSYSYTEACDVYSVGVVLAELIVGHLIGDGQELSMDGTEHFDVYYNCIADKKGKDIPRGWERLKEHADPSILWTPESLDLICNAAIRCMNRTTDGRMTTKELLSTLRQAIHLHNSDTKLCHPVKPESELALCNVCFLNMSNMRCDEGHVLCMPCIEIKIQRGLSGISQVVCPFDGCSSSPFPDEYLYGRMSLDIYNLYIERKTINFLFGNLESKIDKFSDQFSGLTASVDDMKRDVKRNTELLELQLTKIDKLAQGLDRNMSLLSWLADIHSKECPHLVWITPVAVTSRNPKEWIKMVTHQRYKVVFICEHSFQPGHDPIEIKMPRSWIVVMAPWLKLCLRTLQLCNMCRDLPFPLPGLEFKHQCKAMHAFLDVVAEAGTIACDRILDQSKIPTEMGQQVRQCASPAFKLIAEKANEESRAIMWRSKMVAVPVDNADRRLIWVKKEHQNEYINSARSA